MTGGGLVQLIAHGSYGDIVRVVQGTDVALPANLRDSMAHHWFIHREDGIATREDLGTDVHTDYFGEHLESVPLSILPK